VQRFIERIGFCALFLQSAAPPWQSNIRFKGDPSQLARSTDEDRNVHYIQFRWLTVDDFVFSPTCNLYLARPTIHPRIDRQFRSVLRSLGFADAQTIDLLTNTMFLELGWNVVLHAGDKPGAGFGLFGAQITYTGKTSAESTPARLTFCIADIGRGIPATLRKAYSDEKDPKFKLRSQRGSISERTDIVRYALYPHSTSRTDVPSELDRSGFRGLSFVASALIGTGDMSIRSDGGAVTLNGQISEVVSEPSDEYSDYPILGTQVVGRLNRTPEIIVEAPVDSLPHRLPDADIVPVCDLSGRCSVLSDLEDVKRLVNGMKCSNACVVLDLGYGDGTARSLEYLCKTIIRRYPDKWFIFWCTTVPWSEMAALHGWLEPQNLVGFLPPLFVRSFGDARFLGFTDLSGARQHYPNHPALPWIEEAASAAPRATDVPALKTARFTAATYLDVATNVNTAYVQRGFSTASFGAGAGRNGSYGFFRGSIHLLRGPPAASRYFSLLSNLSGNEANVRRWSEACAAAMIQLLASVEVSHERLVLLGFTGTMREVMGRAYLRLTRDYRAYMLLTFDVPSKEEIASKIHRGDQVLLATDVISTGSLVESVSSLVARVEASVIGVISLIDSRQPIGGVEPLTQFGNHRLPVVTAGKLHPAQPNDDDLSDDKFWVDPVSLVPIRERAWGWDESYDAKIEKTMRMVIDSVGLRCGHIIDGTRHTSVYVDLQAMLDNTDTAVMEQIASTVTERLVKRGWRDFQPSVALYPGGISRVEPVPTRAPLTGPQETNVTVYKTAVRSYANALGEMWPSLTPIEVLRAFDPGGGSRCARTVEVPHTIAQPINDVVVADDGMWSGSTVNALMRLAVSLGAKRILVLPLLARISPLEAEQLESVELIGSKDAARKVDVCYAFPLLLPVPFYGIHDCPYEVTIDRLRDRRGRLPMIAPLADWLLDSLEGRTPSEARVRTTEYAEMWLRLRTYVELASLSQEYLDKLATVVRDSTAEEGLLAMFVLFTEEWRLLGRSRLRQAIRPQLRKRAVESSVGNSTSREVRMAALTLLRSLFCETFLEQLPELPAIIVEDLPCLERAVLQVATLNEQWRRSKFCLNFVDQVADLGPAVLARNIPQWGPAEMDRYFNVVRTCKALSVELRLIQSAPTSTTRAAAIELLRLLMEDPDVSHRTRPVVEIIARSGDSLHQLDNNQFLVMKERWRLEHEPRIANQILPPLKQIHLLLLRTATEGREIATGEFTFLRDNCANVQHALGGLSGGLNFLPEMAKSPFVTNAVVASAASLWRDVLDKNSTTMRLMQQMRAVTVRQLRDEFIAEIGSRFAAAGRSVTAKPRKNDAFSSKALIFAPSDLLRGCIANVLDNLLRYASKPGTSLQIEIGLDEDRTTALEPIVVFSVRNDGAPLKVGAEMGSGGRRVAGDLALYGGLYHLPCSVLEQPWKVLQQMSFLTW
jgi:adenine/guanine phosphoribosyltransferase-like PRPP-binding protein